MKKLLSLPPNLVDCFHDVTGLPRDEYFCSSDPKGHRLGSGGGTVWLLQQSRQWLGGERCIVLHAGGQSKRLPAYAVSGKILTPIPVFRWERGQRLSQSLLDLQLPLYERMMEQAPQRLTTMIVSGDVYIRAAERIGPIPDADVVCYGLWLDASIAKNHGVFVSDRRTPGVLKQMLQKPSTEQLSNLLHDHFYLTDIGIWLLSDRAVRLLEKRSMAAAPHHPSPTTQHPSPTACRVGLKERLMPLFRAAAVVAIIITVGGALQAPWDNSWNSPADYATLQQSVDTVAAVQPVRAENISDVAVDSTRMLIMEQAKN